MQIRRSPALAWHRKLKRAGSCHRRVTGPCFVHERLGMNRDLGAPFPQRRCCARLREQRTSWCHQGHATARTAVTLVKVVRQGLQPI